MKKLAVAVCAVVAFGLMGIGATVWAESWDNWRYAVAYHKDRDVLQMLAGGQDINMQDSDGWTALHVAAEDGNVTMVQLLLDHGARTDLKTKTGKTALDVGRAYPGVQAAIRVRMVAPSLPQAPLPGGKPNGLCAQLAASTIHDGRTPQNRPRLTARDDVWYNHPEQLAELLDDCVEVNSPDDNGSTLLHTAAERDRVAIARILLDHKADISAPDKFGNNPAAYATSPDMKALLGPAKKAPVTGNSKLKTECAQKYQADVALCSDMSCRTRSQNRWQKCLKTGQYW